MILPLQPSGMNNSRLDRLIRELGGEVDGEPGYWRFSAMGTTLLCVTDESHDRMRIMTPVAEIKDISEEELRSCMEANFDRALDARYCIKGDTLWGAFIHPLNSLREEQFHSAVRQVCEVARNFGTTYSSGELIFGDGGSE